MTIRSAPLTEVQLRGEVDFIRRFFAQRGVESVSVALGWGCRLTFDEMWQHHAVPVAELDAFLQAQQRAGVFHLGQSDVSIADAGGQMGFVLCHEGDIHFDGASERVAEVAAHWRGEGWGVAEE